jgi:hypothetical protein
MSICQIYGLSVWQKIIVVGHAHTHKSTENRAQRNEIWSSPAPHFDAPKPRISLIILQKSIMYTVDMYYVVKFPHFG